MLRRSSSLLAVGALVGCGSDPAVLDAGAIDACACLDTKLPDDAMPPEYPPTIQDTGLCLDAACTSFAADVVEYEPRWELWSDTAAKRRWIHLPAGAQIDTSDMDYWRYPVGTKLWKDFVRDGVRVETRYIVKTGAADGAWTMIAYVWNGAQTEALPTIPRVENANGTDHDVPSRNQCATCHDRLPGRVLGFSALQLDHDAPAGILDLDGAIAAGWLSDPPAGTTPHYPLPGDGVDDVALGYMHANCGHCHNPESDVQGTTPLKLRLQVGLLGSVDETPAFATTVGVVGMDAIELIVPGEPAQSRLYQKFTSVVPVARMPPLGTEDIDPDGSSALEAWIESLGP